MRKSIMENGPHYVSDEHHHTKQHMSFIVPLYVNPAPIDSERILAFWDHRIDYVSRPLSQLTPDDCRMFCWKDCAIYGNAGMTGQHHFRLFDQVYEEWFPHRDREKEFNDGTFFAKFMRLTPAVEKVEEILGFHRTLCQKLQSEEDEILDRQPFPPYVLKPDGVRREWAFRLRVTFLSVFVVANADWEEHGVLLVCDSEKCVEELEVRESGEDVTSYKVDDGSDLGDARIFRCPLKRAMKIVVSQDAERAKKRKEYNEMFDRVYGSDDEA